MISEAQLQELEQLCKEATPGPWMNYEQAKKRLDIGWNDWFSILAYSESGKPFILCSSNGAMTTAKAKEEARLKEGLPEPEGPTKCDMAFIAASREAVPALIVRIRQLEAENNQYYNTMMKLNEREAQLKKEADWLAGYFGKCHPSQPLLGTCAGGSNKAECIRCWRMVAKKAILDMGI